MIPMDVVRLPGVEFIFRVKPTVGPLHSRPRFFISLTNCQPWAPIWLLAAVLFE